MTFSWVKSRHIWAMLGLLDKIGNLDKNAEKNCHRKTPAATFTTAFFLNYRKRVPNLYLTIYLWPPKSKSLPNYQKSNYEIRFKNLSN